MHIGTFTQRGTYDSAALELAKLAELGVSCLEIMPLSEFAGEFGWGYDGVDPFAPSHLYGHPDDLRRLVDKAHSLGLAVILDVVYNHLGPDGNYLGAFSPAYFTSRHQTDWGAAINFDGEDSEPVREYFLANAAYWIDEFHLDGLRIDATQNVYDAGKGEHILAAITRVAREAAPGRSIIIIGENEPQAVILIRPRNEGGYGMDALWNDDLHHSAMVVLSAHNDAYYTDYLGSPQEFISGVKYGYLYQGQWYKWQKQRRGTPTFGVKPASFVTFIQNHDQVANSARGQRCHNLAAPGALRAMTALLLLAPGTPMLFQGQEFASSNPFLFFADQKPEIAALVRKGRAEFLSQWRSLVTVEMQASIPDPALYATFERSKLDHSERDRDFHREMWSLHQDLLRLRREDPVFSAQAPGAVDGAVLGTDSFVLRFFGAARSDRLLVMNFGIDVHLNPAPEPLLAPPENATWEILWSSEDRRYGGWGTPLVDTPEDNWRIPGQAAVVLAPRRSGAEWLS